MQHNLLGSHAQRPLWGMGGVRAHRLGLAGLHHGVGVSRRSIWSAQPAGHRQPAIRATVSASQQRDVRTGAGQKSVPVLFKVKHEVRWGQNMAVVGDHPSLGSWKARKAAQMGWHDGHVWQTEVAFPAGTSLEFKMVSVDKNGDVEWEGGQNRTLQVPGSGVGHMQVVVEWGEDMKVSLDGAAEEIQGQGQGQGRSQEAQRSRDYGSESEGEGRARVSVLGSMSGGSGSVTSSFEERLPSEEWQGRAIRFMQSNEHTRDRSGVWDTYGLEGPLLALVEGDREHGSWLGKLGVVKKLLVDDAHRMRPDLNALAAAYVYLQWIATGAVPCVESGGHQRPNRHAELSRMIFRSLEWVIEDAVKAGSGGLSVGLVARRLHTRLPSFTEQFTQSVPLTRIRDIAHRGDIPGDLKREIKHTIQNKLHRNAGPEDLVATESMLARITSAPPGTYSEAFLHEFRTFTAELRDFFNAGSFADMLAAVHPSMDDSHWQLVDRFLSSKAKLDAAGPEGATPNLVMDALHGTTSVRALLAATLSSGLRNDAPDKALIMRQRYRLCEVRAEDYAFVLLSRFINMLEEKGGAEALAHGHDGMWGLPIGALVLGLRNVGLGGFELGECMAVEREMTAWQQAGGLTQAENALRLRATLQRLQRLTEGYSQVLMDAYSERARKLGTALGLDPYLISIFSEAEIRASMVFQISKLCSLLLRATGLVASVGQWEVIVGGEARGMLMAVDQLEPGCLAAAGGKPVVALVRDASGDEEVATLRPQLQGVILRHAIPHLSHLGVRARQDKLPFVCCEDDSLLNDVASPLLGTPVKLVAGTEGASLTRDTGGDTRTSYSENGNGTATSSTVALPAPVQKVTGSMRVIPLEDATAATCGAKGASCGELLRLAKQCDAALSQRGGNGDSAGALFQAPDGVCLPYGCMELALQAEGRWDEFERLVGRLGRTNGSELDDACGQLDQLIRGLRIPQQVLQQVSGSFTPGGTVIVRSSANVEDLAGMSGAGLYESVPNVDSNELRGLQDAICSVWASLFTRRAVLSRQAAGVPQDSACMAVVVQSMLAPELSFVLHTAHPVSRDPDTLAAELAPGLGETLAAGTRGSGWRLEVDKPSGKVATKAFANFSHAYLPVGSGTGNGAAAGEGGHVHLQLVDYSSLPMSGMNMASEDVRGAVGRRLTAVGCLLEHEFGGPQDVEGCFSGGQLWVVQTRPQP